MIELLRDVVRRRHECPDLYSWGERLDVDHRQVGISDRRESLREVVNGGVRRRAGTAIDVE